MCTSQQAHAMHGATLLQAEALQQLSPCDVAALQKCLKENDGDREKVRR